MQTRRNVIALNSEMGAATTKARSVITADVDLIDPRNLPQRKPDSAAILTTIPNIKYMLDFYGIEVKYNVIKKRTDYRIPGLKTTLDNRENTSVNHILSLAQLNGFKVNNVPAFVESIADGNEYNPVLEWVTSKPWDGWDRLKEFCNTLQVPLGYPIALKEILVTKWLRSCVAALIKPNFHARGVLTLQGAQGLGKTTWVRALIPDHQLRESVLKVDHHLDASDKDSKLLAVSHWIVEIGELDSSLKKDISRLKGFLTADTDKIRRPYARAESEYQRRTVFCATVNDGQFLVDPTGNSRFWTVPVISINYQHDIDMQQVFAQVLEEVQRGGAWWLDGVEEGMLTEMNKQHRAVSVIRELLMDNIVAADHERAGKARKLSAIQVLQEVMRGVPTNQQCKEAAQVLREIYGEPVKSGGVNKWPVVLREADPGDLSYYTDEEYNPESDTGFEDLDF